MSTDFASLVVKADTSQVANANTDLQKLINVSSGVERQISIMEDEIIKASRAANVFDMAFRQGEQVTRAMLSPTERYNSNLSELRKLLALDAISQETYNRAMVEAEKEFKDLSGETERYKQEQLQLNRTLAEGKRVTDAVLTPTEKYKQSVSVLDDLLLKDAISQETYNRSLRQANNEFKQANSHLPNFLTSLNMLRFGLISIATGAGILFATNLYNANNELEAMRLKMNAAIPVIGGGARELQWITDEADRMGLRLRSTAKEYSDFAAAAVRSNISMKDTRQIFTDIAETGVSMKIGPEQMSAALRALSQMASKGVVSMEELRQQLGDSSGLPGVAGIAAKSMGMVGIEFDKLVSSGKLLTSDFLPKFAAAMKKELGGSFLEASRSIQANANRIDNDLLLLKGAFAEIFIGNANEGGMELDRMLKSLIDNFGNVKAAIQILLVPVSVLWNGFQILGVNIAGFGMLLVETTKMGIMPFITGIQLLMDYYKMLGDATTALMRGDFKALSGIGGEFLDNVKKRSSDLANSMSGSFEEIKLTVKAVLSETDKNIGDIATQIGKSVLAVENAGDKAKKVGTDLAAEILKQKKLQDEAKEIEGLESRIRLLQEGLNITKENLTPLEQLYVAEKKLFELRKSGAIDQEIYKRALDKSRLEFNKTLEAEIDSLSSGLLTQEEEIYKSYSRRHDSILDSTILTELEKNDLIDKLEKDHSRKMYDSLTSGLLTEEQILIESYNRRSEEILNSSVLSENQKNMAIQLLAVDHAEKMGEYQDQLYDSFYNGLLTEEEEISLSYDRRMEKILESTLITETQKADLIYRLNKDNNDKLNSLQSQRLNSMSSAFNDMSNLTKEFAGEQSGIYKALFTVGKAFTIADSGIQLSNAMMKALNTPFPANLAAVGTVFTAGTAILSDLKSINFAGAKDKGGNIQAGQWGIVAEYADELVNGKLVKGPARVTSSNDTSKLLKENDSGTVSATFNIYDRSGERIETIQAQIRSKEYNPVIRDIMRRAGELGLN